MLLQYLEVENTYMQLHLTHFFFFSIQQILLRQKQHHNVAPNSAIRTRSARDFSMFCLQGRKVRSQVPCRFPVRSGQGTKPQLVFVEESCLHGTVSDFQGLRALTTNDQKNCAKKNKMDAFYSLKKQSCFHNSSKLLLYVSERTSTRKC